jgi:hypothetical protein
MAKRKTLSIDAARTPETKAQAQEDAAAILAIRKELQDKFFQAKTDRYNQLLERHQGESSPQPEVPVQNAAVEVSVEEEPETVLAPEAEQDQGEMITRVINGQQVTKSLDQWMEIASKVANADDYIENAKRTLKNVTQQAAPAHVPAPQVTLEDAELIQSGSREEALETLNKIVNKSVDAATQGIREQTETAQAQMAIKRVLEENKDLAADKMLFLLSKQLIDQSIADGEVFDAGNRVKDFELRAINAWAKVRKYHETRQVSTELNTRTNQKKNLGSGGSTTRINNSAPSQVQTYADSRQQALADMQRQRRAQRN